MSDVAKKPAEKPEKLAEKLVALAAEMRSSAASLPAGTLCARAACYAMPAKNHFGFNHLELWPGRLEDFRPGDRGDDLRAAAAYLILEIERLEKPAEPAA